MAFSHNIMFYNDGERHHLQSVSQTLQLGMLKLCEHYTYFPCVYVHFSIFSVITYVRDYNILSYSTSSDNDTLFHLVPI